jgi:hypothetical protein
MASEKSAKGDWVRFHRKFGSPNINTHPFTREFVY